MLQRWGRVGLCPGLELIAADSPFQKAVVGKMDEGKMAEGKVADQW